MKTRIITGLGILAFIVLVIYTRTVTPYVMDAGIVILAMFCGLEMSNLLSKIGFYNSKLMIAIYPIASYVVYQLSVSKNLSIYLLIVLQIALLIVLTAVVSFISLINNAGSDNEIKTRKLKVTTEQFSMFKAVQTLFGMIYPGFIIMFTYIINNLGKLDYIFNSAETNSMQISVFFLVLIFAIPMIVDTFAMLTGSLIKGPKLCPKISPNKTVSGAIGGFIWGTVITICIFFIFNAFDSYKVIFEALNFSWWKLCVLGAVASIMCQVGDIFESYLKRKAKVKDAGDILPGHGGFLDRFDSHIANILVVFVFVLILL